ncbi:hypothetical protein BpHYR1_003962 [Brachionus plicatilis]|uniref:Uncharacterized protein n=1 Tax=Brachionus plicatilis TaxID=10195 RepID=A0A3M7RXT7_BRAPC|nr:hypothetical protein BpHYR1_003962 [Brachionus plicatilis]
MYKSTINNILPSTPCFPKEGGEVLTEPQVLKKLEEEELSKKEKKRKKSDKATSNDPAPNVDLCKQKFGSAKKINLNGFRVKDALTGHVLNVYLKSLIRKVNFIVRKNCRAYLDDICHNCCTFVISCLSQTCRFRICCEIGSRFCYPCLIVDSSFWTPFHLKIFNHLLITY